MLDQPFQIELLEFKKANTIKVTTEQGPSTRIKFEVPNTWEQFGGVRIYNPTSQTVALLLTVLQHKQFIDSISWVALLLGMTSVAVGIILTGYGLKSARFLTLAHEIRGDSTNTAISKIRQHRLKSGTSKKRPRFRGGSKPHVQERTRHNC